MKAVLEILGKEYLVSEGDRILVNYLPLKESEPVKNLRVLALIDEKGIILGEPEIKDVRVEAIVVSQNKGKKIRILTYKPKKHTKRTLGYRDKLTEIEIKKIHK